MYILNLNHHVVYMSATHASPALELIFMVYWLC